MPPIPRTVRTAPAWLIAVTAVASALGAVVLAQSEAPTEVPTESTPMAGESTAGTAPAAPDAASISAYPLNLILPDSETVYGPTLYRFDLGGFIDGQGGFLAQYVEAVEGKALTGTQIVQQVAEDYGVGPRLLLALIEMQSGWLREPEPVERDFPLPEPLPGLHAALTSAADALNRGYYAHRGEANPRITLADGATVEVPDVNAGTFAVLAYLSRGQRAETWSSLEAPSRFYAAWTSLFGEPYDFQVMEMFPDTLRPKDLAWPFSPVEEWFYVAGPHSPWGSGGPRAAIDFAPGPAEATGCHGSGYQVLAVADGVVLWSRSEGVAIDIDGDKFVGTGWVHVYTHLHTTNRVRAGTRVQAGDFLGYPSCEGGLVTATRLSFARRYNGEWIPADHPTAPLVLGGWAATPGLVAGEGFLLHAGIAPRTAAATKIPALNGVTALSGGP